MKQHNITHRHKSEHNAQHSSATQTQAQTHTHTHTHASVSHLKFNTPAQLKRAPTSATRNRDHHPQRTIDTRAQHERSTSAAQAQHERSTSAARAQEQESNACARALSLSRGGSGLTVVALVLVFAPRLRRRSTSFTAALATTTPSSRRSCDRPDRHVMDSSGWPPAACDLGDQIRGATLAGSTLRRRASERLGVSFSMPFVQLQCPKGLGHWVSLKGALRYK